MAKSRPLCTARSEVNEKAVKMPMLKRKWETRRSRREQRCPPPWDSALELAFAEQVNPSAAEWSTLSADRRREEEGEMPL